MSYAHASAKARPLTRREHTVFMKLVSQLRDDSLTRLRLQTKLISIVCAVAFLLIGGGYAFAGSKVIGSNHPYQLLLNIEGNLHVHGAILMALGAFVLYTSAHYRTASRVALWLMGFYSLCTALLIMGSWLLGHVSWAAPWWYLTAAALCLILVRVSPPVNMDQRRGTERSERA